MEKKSAREGRKYEANKGRWPTKFPGFAVGKSFTTASDAIAGARDAIIPVRDAIILPASDAIAGVRDAIILPARDAIAKVSDAIAISRDGKYAKPYTG
ncbi:MAG: hypothetical protein LBJ13_01725 [Puniceicoccales bacterium]|nr:hypothetical protein [Puniceicoccales bacterium]